MSRYIDVDSSFRNRQNFPSTAHFEAITSSHGSLGVSDAVDPFTSAYPLAVFSAVDIPIGGVSLGVDLLDPSSSSASFVANSNLDLPEGYTVGLAVHEPVSNESRRILAWHRISASRFSVEIDAPFTQPPASLYIYRATTYTSDPPRVFIPLSGSFVGHHLVNITSGGTARIGAFNPHTHMATLSSEVTWQDDDIVILRKENGAYSSTTVVSATSKTATLGQAYDNSVVGMLLMLVNTFTRNINVRRIIGVSGATLHVAPAFSGTIDSTEYAEILTFTQDNYQPMLTSFVGHSREMYEVELMYTILPNVVLRSGGRWWDYPYVYIEFANTDESISSGALVTNNPAGSRAMFKVPTSGPDCSPFLKLCSFMRPRALFRVGSGFRVCVKLPNGDVAHTQLADTGTGAPVNPHLQFSFLFRLVPVRC